MHLSSRMVVSMAGARARRRVKNATTFCQSCSLAFAWSSWVCVRVGSSPSFCKAVSAYLSERRKKVEALGYHHSLDAITGAIWNCKTGKTDFAFSVRLRDCSVKHKMSVFNNRQMWNQNNIAMVTLRGPLLLQAFYRSLCCINTWQ